MITLTDKAPIVDVARALVLSEVKIGLRFYAGINSKGAYLMLSLLAANTHGYSNVLREWIQELPTWTRLGKSLTELVHLDASRDDLADLVTCHLQDLISIPELIRPYLPSLIRAGGVL